MAERVKSQLVRTSGSSQRTRPRQNLLRLGKQREVHQVNGWRHRITTFSRHGRVETDAAPLLRLSAAALPSARGLVSDKEEKRHMAIGPLLESFVIRGGFLN